MTVPALQLVYLVLALAGGAGWVLAALRPRRGPWVALATVALVLRVGVVVLLGGHGWWFVQEKVLVGLPLAVGGAVLALVVLVVGRGRPAMPARQACLLGAAYATAGELVLVLVVGYPVGPLSGGVVVLLVAAATLVTWLVLAGRDPGVVRGVSLAAAFVLLLPLGLAWWASRAEVHLEVVGPGAVGAAAAAVPGTGAHTGSGHAADEPATDELSAAGGGAPTVDVTELRTPADVPGQRVPVTLTARESDLTLPSGEVVQAWSFGSLPGPEIRAQVGQVVEAELHNEDVRAGVSVHWHGYDVPNGEDGVAGVTQDAVLPGQSFTYRFVADQPGTYWYHTHQSSSDGVRRGLFGTLVVLPASGPVADLDLVLPVHTLSGTTTLAGSDEVEQLAATPGQRVRLRLLDADQVPHRFGVDGAGFRVVAVDGTDVPGAEEVSGLALRVPAGGRYDVELTMPSHPVRLAVDGEEDVGLELVPDAGAGADADAAPGDADRWAVPDEDLDLLAYGSPPEGGAGAGPGTAPAPDVTATLVLDRLPRFDGGVPVYGYTIDGKVYPHVPSTVVDEGDRVLLRIVNRSSETHPMHPHGHHVRVLSVDGREPTGAAVLRDTFDVRPGEVWEVELLADNPGIWMDHCHNLDHAAQGMVTHLVYRGVTTPFRHGGSTGNAPE
ncbi:multicopper oxidase family protein [Oerskovia sp. NPDC060287]|uniref:multicopper oxidase family protein n=1 Tax=Oerskovia sp. NPDC060287 TaxID=3347095 RepID=UPI00364C0661